MKTIIKLFCIVFAGILLVSCEKEFKITPFLIETTSVKIEKGEVTLYAQSNYVGSIVEKGFCISRHSNPTVSDNLYVAEHTDLSDYEYKSSGNSWDSYSSIPDFSVYDYEGYQFRKCNSDRVYDYSDVMRYKTIVTDLQVGVKYYVRAYAKNANNNIAYSKEYYFIVNN